MDFAILEDLELQMGSREIALGFARDYAEMWVRRQHTLMTALERQDHHAALDAALSLKNASAMVGGVRLARLAEALETAIRTGADPDRGRALLDLVADHGRATVSELRNGYLSRSVPEGPHSTGG